MFRSSVRSCTSVALACGVAFSAATTHAQDRNRGPADTLVVCGVTTVTTEPRYTALGCGFNNSGATYDLVSGQSSVGAIGRGAEASLSAEDLFVISGPTSSTPIPFSAQLAVHAGGTYYAFASARIGSGGQVQEFTSPWSWPGSDFYQVLTLPMSLAAGEHFHLAVHLHAFSPSGKSTSQATASARLTFTLPPKYVVTSSQGYSSAPTPTRATTWGRLKTIYR